MSTRLSAATKPIMLSETDRHIASRFAYGVDESLIREVRAAGSGMKWFERQLAYASIDNSAADAAASWYPLLSHDPATKFANSRSGGPDSWDYSLALTNYWMAHALLSKRHVHEQMVSFWGNLLYVSTYETRVFPWAVEYDQTIRTYAMTSYRQLLRACIVQPSMSGWLNNNENTKQGINENLGRELLELFTVGSGAGYTEDDVKNSARLLTGFRTKQGDALKVWYDPSKHWTGPVRIMGFRHANADPDGRAALNAYLDYLALHPATAGRVARRLCQRFVSDNPPSGIVSAVAAAYRASGSDVASCLRALVSHPQFAVTRRGRLMTPVEDVLSTARVLGIRPVRPRDQESSFTQHCVWMATDAGQAPFRWPRPDGFPEDTTVYASPSRLIRAWNQHVSMAGNWWKSTGVSRPSAAACLPASWPRRLDELVEHQSRILLGKSADPLAVDAICRTLDLKPYTKFASASNVSDWCFVTIRGSILDLPEGIKR